VIALAAFSLAAAFRSECEDNQHGSHRKNHDWQRDTLAQSLGLRHLRGQSRPCTRPNQHAETEQTDYE
jgi:hypothetical protein